jgi:hypothetical protein
VRLFEEQCEVVSDQGGENDSVGGPGGGDLRVKVVEPKSVDSDSLQSPYDPEATYGHKGKGYEVQVAETCDEGNPYQLITGTSVNGAQESDQQALVPMLDQLADSGMLPDELLADTGYGSGANIVEAAQRGVDLQARVQDPDAPATPEHFAAPVGEQDPPEAGPPAAVLDAGWSVAPVAQQGALEVDAPPAEQERSPLGLEAFSFARTFEQVLGCPAGNAPKEQHLAGSQLIAVFSSEHCSGCSLAGRCPTRQLCGGDRQLRRSPETVATEVRQHEQQQPAFKERYRQRSGSESTNQELKGRHGLGDLRIRGKPRVELAAELKSLAVNVKRAVQYHVLQMALCASCAC